MNVVKSTTRPCSTRAHLLCVPGSTASTPRSSGPIAPSNCVSSPRMTSGMPAASRVATPGTIVSASCGALHDAIGKCRERRGAVDVRRLDPALAAADHSARDARRRVGAPVAEQLRERRLEAAVAHVLDAERNAAPVLHATLGVEAIGARGGCSPIDCDERRSGH